MEREQGSLTRYNPDGDVLVVVEEYCQNTPAARAILTAVAAYTKAHRKGRHVFVFCNENFPHLGLEPENSAMWKAMFLEDQELWTALDQFSVSATNMVEEALEASKEAHRRGIEPRKIVIFCDHWQVRPLRMVWRAACPGIKDVRIEFHKVKCKFGGTEYVLPYMQSHLRWRLHNFFHFFTLVFFGVRGLQ
ncbi:MAG: hypothetical protein AAB798_01640 [Patescibacteria group bacterium]